MYPGVERDLMRIQIPDAQASPLLYYNGAVRDVFGARAPVDGESICMSPANTDPQPTGIDCGVVADPWTDWTDNLGNHSWGGDADGIATMGGDSGSPLYALHVNGPPNIWAIGIHNTSTGKFAHVMSALNWWDINIVTQ
jgi:hypothetical protein